METVDFSPPPTAPQPKSAVSLELFDPPSDKPPQPRAAGDLTKQNKHRVSVADHGTDSSPDSKAAAVQRDSAAAKAPAAITEGEDTLDSSRNASALDLKASL